MLVIDLEGKILCLSILGSDLFDIKSVYHHIHFAWACLIIPYEKIVIDPFLTIILLLRL